MYPLSSSTGTRTGVECINPTPRAKSHPTPPHPTSQAQEQQEQERIRRRARRQWLRVIHAVPRVNTVRRLCIIDATPTVQERRQWLRDIHVVFGPANPSSDTLSVDTEVLQLLQFFQQIPGLRRQIGAIIALYYCPLAVAKLEY